MELRPLRHSDGAALDAIFRDSQVKRMLPPRVRRETGVQFTARVLGENRRRDGYAFAVRWLGTPEAIGLIRLRNWSHEERSAEVGYWIRRRDWGRGAGSEALHLVCRFGFRSMRLHRIVANVVAGNTRSIRTLEGAGFRQEGKRRLSARVSRGWADELEFGLLRADWTG
ncbi:MAG TPA: GNAT family protein [Thermoplasmata archaeon]|nr:GNAT family protein [Thermoplasmata archaeon]